MIASDLDARSKVLKKFPQAHASKVIWPTTIYWIMPSKRKECDSISEGRPTAKEAWENAAERIRKGLE